MYNNIRSQDVNIGAWCNGNTWVSKTFVEGSSPSAPAIRYLYDLLPQVVLFLCVLHKCCIHLVESIAVQMDVCVVSYVHVGMS